MQSRAGQRTLWLIRWIGIWVATPLFVSIGVWALATGHILGGVAALLAAPVSLWQSLTGWGLTHFGRAWPKGQVPRWNAPPDD